MGEPIIFKHPLSPEMRQRVRELRRNATEAEQLLWKLLRNRQLMGHKFRRQQPVMGYIVDFYCHEARLVIEVDGGGHADQDQAAYDCQRTEALEQEGLRVIRFWNHEVLSETEAVVGAIAEALNALTPKGLSRKEDRTVSK